MTTAVTLEEQGSIVQAEESVKELSVNYQSSFQQIWHLGKNYKKAIGSSCSLPLAMQGKQQMCGRIRCSSQMILKWNILTNMWDIMLISSWTYNHHYVTQWRQHHADEPMLFSRDREAGQSRSEEGWGHLNGNTKFSLHSYTCYFVLVYHIPSE